jgi:tRNA (guanine-N7-)-methyltransferase
MSRRSLMRGAPFQPPDPQSIERYLLFFSNKELFRNPDIFPPIDSPHLFGTDLPLQLEIGCGTADFLCALALENPRTNFVGVDVASKALFRAIRTAETYALPNIKFIKGDFKRMYPLLATDALQAVYLHFPDPNMRKRFRKRRIVSPNFLDRINRALVPGGCLSIMTDHHEFFLEMLALIEQDVRFAKTHAERYLIGFEAPAKSRFQRMWERHGLPTLRVELQKAYCPPGCLKASGDSGQHNTVVAAGADSAW